MASAQAQGVSSGFASSRKRRSSDDKVQGIWYHLQQHFGVVRKTPMELVDPQGLVAQALVASKLAARKRRRIGFMNKAGVTQLVVQACKETPEPVCFAKLPEHYIICTQQSLSVGWNEELLCSVGELPFCFCNLGLPESNHMAFPSPLFKTRGVNVNQICRRNQQRAVEKSSASGNKCCRRISQIAAANMCFFVVNK